MADLPLVKDTLELISHQNLNPQIYMVMQLLTHCPQLFPPQFQAIILAHEPILNSHLLRFGHHSSHLSRPGLLQEPQFVLSIDQARPSLPLLV